MKLEHLGAELHIQAESEVEVARLNELAFMLAKKNILFLEPDLGVKGGYAALIRSAVARVLGPDAAARLFEDEQFASTVAKAHETLRQKPCELCGMPTNPEARKAEAFYCKGFNAGLKFARVEQRGEQLAEMGL
jgi:hypothetical protein